MPSSKPSKPKAKSQTQKSKPKPVVRSIDQKRLEKLTAIKAKLELGKHVQNRDLQTWLTRDEFAEIEARWVNEKDRRLSMYGEKPDAIREYESRLSKAILTYNRADSYSQQRKHAAAKKLMAQSQVQFEHALEWLEESLGLDPSLQAWLDRPFDRGDAGLDPDSVPRLVTSRSAARQAGMAKQTIAGIKMQVVSAAIENSSRPELAVQATKPSKKLKELLGVDTSEE